MSSKTLASRSLNSRSDAYQYTMQSSRNCADLQSLGSLLSPSRTDPMPTWLKQPCCCLCFYTISIMRAIQCRGCLLLRQLLSFVLCAKPSSLLVSLLSSLFSLCFLCVVLAMAMEAPLSCYLRSLASFVLQRD